MGKVAPPRWDGRLNTDEMYFTGLSNKLNALPDDAVVTKESLMPFAEKAGQELPLYEGEQIGESVSRRWDWSTYTSDLEGIEPGMVLREYMPENTVVGADFAKPIAKNTHDLVMDRNRGREFEGIRQNALMWKGQPKYYEGVFSDPDFHAGPFSKFESVKDPLVEKIMAKSDSLQDWDTYHKSLADYSKAYKERYPDYKDVHEVLDKANSATSQIQEVLDISEYGTFDYITETSPHMGRTEPFYTRYKQGEDGLIIDEHQSDWHQGGIKGDMPYSSNWKQKSVEDAFMAAKRSGQDYIKVPIHHTDGSWEAPPGLSYRDASGGDRGSSTTSKFYGEMIPREYRKIANKYNVPMTIEEEGDTVYLRIKVPDEKMQFNLY